MNGIPFRYLTNMGVYNISIHGATVSVNSTEFEYGPSVKLVETKISDFRTCLAKNNLKVVGVDIKKKPEGTRDKRYLLALCTSDNCLIFQLDDVPASISKFFNDHDVCFVGPTRLFSRHFGLEKVVETGDLAARVLKKPGLIKSAVADLAREVGVRYDGPPNGSGSEVQVDTRNPTVLTEEMVKSTINDAVVNYLIGCKLLSNVSSN